MRRAISNIDPIESWVSVLAGLGLTWASVRRRAPAARVAAAAAGLFFMARGASSYCAVKSALWGHSSLSEGLKEQWNRVRAQFSAGPNEVIETLEDLHVAELRELHSAETRLHSALENLPSSLQDAALVEQLRGYAGEVSSRRADLARLLRARGVSPREHSDQAMRGLLLETRKVSHFSPASLRDAALLSSLQRALHFKIAGYGTAATYATQLGRTDEAAQLAQYADRDKQLDAALTARAARAYRDEITSS